MNNSTRCLYESSFAGFLNENANWIFGVLCDRYHGEALTTTREAWKAEIEIMQKTLSEYKDKV